MLVRPAARFDLAVKLRETGASVGEIYTFISGLYFRGKMAYAEHFDAAPQGVPGSLVMVPGAGLIPPQTIVTIEQLEAIADVDVDEENRSFTEPLRDAAKLLDQHGGPECQYVLLGSIASGKYVEPLLEIFGDRLMFPADFVGRGDMSRGGLMLRCVRAGTELAYIPVKGAVRHGARPPKLPKLSRPTPWQKR
jgi:hypothetical protein